jgi:hypothetical protein
MTKVDTLLSDDKYKNLDQNRSFLTLIGSIPMMSSSFILRCLELLNSTPVLAYLDIQLEIESKKK